MAKHIIEENIKTIGGQSIVGKGNITIEGEEVKTDNKTISLNESGELQLSDEIDREIFAINGGVITIQTKNGGYASFSTSGIFGVEDSTSYTISPYELNFDTADTHHRFYVPKSVSKDTYMTVSVNGVEPDEMGDIKIPESEVKIDNSTISKNEYGELQLGVKHPNFPVNQVHLPYNTVFIKDNNKMALTQSGMDFSSTDNNGSQLSTFYVNNSEVKIGYKFAQILANERGLDFYVPSYENGECSIRMNKAQQIGVVSKINGVEYRGDLVNTAYLEEYVAEKAGVVSFSDQFMRNEEGELMLGYISDGQYFYGFNSVENEQGVKSAFIGNYEGLINLENSALIIVHETDETSTSSLSTLKRNESIQSASSLQVASSLESSSSILSNTIHVPTGTYNSGFTSSTSAVSGQSMISLEAVTSPKDSQSKKSSINMLVSENLSTIHLTSEYIRIVDSSNDEAYDLLDILREAKKSLHRSEITPSIKNDFLATDGYDAPVFRRVGDVVYYYFNIRKEDSHLEIGDVLFTLGGDYTPFKPIPIIAQSDSGTVSLEIRTDGNIVVTRIDANVNQKQVYCSGNYLHV